MILSEKYLCRLRPSRVRNIIPQILEQVLWIFQRWRKGQNSQWWAWSKMWAPHPTLSRIPRPPLSSPYFPSRRLNSRAMGKDRPRPLKILWGRGNCLWILWISQKSSKPHSQQGPTPSIGWCHLRPPPSTTIRIMGAGTWATLWIWIIIRVLPKPLRSRGPAEISKGFLIT